jgi:hypothetical protein
MWPQACNLMATLAFPPWTQSISREVYMTIDGEERVPFHAYVQPESMSAYATERSSPTFNFRELPAELQYRILALCSAGTLFQLMHVCSILRKEAAKLFWKNTHAYFLIEADWLLQGPYSGTTHWDMAFLPYVEHLEVEYPHLTNDTMYQQPYRATLNVRQDRVTLFWANLQLRFPRAKRVMFNHSAVRTIHEEHVRPPSVPLALQLLLQACPPSINASALVLESQTPTSNTSMTNAPTSPWYRPVYRFRADNGLWEKSKRDPNYTTVFMPAKRFQGPVGEFRRIQYLWNQKIELQRQGLWPLMVEARDRYHFDGKQHQPFSCLLLECNAYFDRPGLWMVHAAEVHPTIHEQTLLSVLPTSLRVEFGKRINGLESRTEALKEDYRRLQAAWNSKDEDTRRELECSWVQQLESDKIWNMGERLTEDEHWPEFIMCV